MRVLDDWLLTPQRAALHLPTATAVVADLHLGYAQARQQRGDAIPLAEVAAVLQPLQAVVARHPVKWLVVAGDLFEAGGSAELVRDLCNWLALHQIELTAVVPGNHDRGIARWAAELPLFVDGYGLGRWHIVHGDGLLPSAPLLQGHEHPALRLAAERATPCFLIEKERLILPAFSADAAGVNVFKSRRWAQFRAAVPVGATVLDFGPVGELAAKLRRREVPQTQ